MYVCVCVCVCAKARFHEPLTSQENRDISAVSCPSCFIAGEIVPHTLWTEVSWETLNLN